jgi:hypothetical protein
MAKALIFTEETNILESLRMEIRMAKAYIIMPMAINMKVISGLTNLTEKAS